MNAVTGYGLTDLPGKNCGACGFRSCAAMAERLEDDPDLIRRCIQLSSDKFAGGVAAAPAEAKPAVQPGAWRDSLGREFDFYLEHFPEDPGPREIIIPHNPMLTREMEITVGDTLIGRPLGMSCGCPIAHCGVAREVDRRTGVIVWCVTGPLGPRKNGFKDLGYYIAEGYEGLITKSRVEPGIGLRYYFQPRMCMLQWRHSGLINFLNRTPTGLQVRLEGLWIG
jgi:uncharacterized Fe-S cluster-containing protein